MNCEKLFAALDATEEKFLRFWQDICNIESPTHHKPGVDAVSAYIAEAAAAIGLEAETVPQEKAGNMVKLTLNNHSAERPIILSAHIDTVHPVGSFGTPPVTVQGDKIYGPGVMDDKGGVAASLYAMQALKDCGYTRRNVVFIAQTDEEVSSKLSNGATIGYMSGEALGCEAFINCEGFKKGCVVLQRKGIARYRLEIIGKAAHSSKCFEGANAVLEAAHKIIALEQFKDKDGITCNCSLISGGDAANSVPTACSFTADMRHVTEEEFDRFDARLREIAATSYIGDTACEVTLVSRRPAMELTERNLAFLEKMNRIYEENGLPRLEAGASLGGSDAANISALGVTTVDSVGCEGGKIHSVEEFAYLRSLKESAKRIASIIYCYDN